MIESVQHWNSSLATLHYLLVAFCVWWHSLWYFASPPSLSSPCVILCGALAYSPTSPSKSLGVCEQTRIISFTHTYISILDLLWTIVSAYGHSVRIYCPPCGVSETISLLNKQNYHSMLLRIINVGRYLLLFCTIGWWILKYKVMKLWWTNSITK